MRSGTSYFNGTVFKKTVLRFWPLWAAYLVVWLIILPLNGLMTLQLENRQPDPSSSYMLNFARGTVPDTVGLCLFMAVVFGVLAAMAVCSHLYNARSANFFGSLSVRREGLFLIHYLAGLSFLIVPNVLVFLLTLLVELAGGAVVWTGLLFWLAVSCGECFLFYSMAVFCGMFTGHLLALPVFYGVLNGLVMGVIFLVQSVLQMFYYGFHSLDLSVISAAEWCTPIYKLRDVFAVWYPKEELPYGLSNPEGLVISNLDSVGIYALAALALAVCSFLLYRARRLESAGDVVSVRPMQPVFKYGVSICAGLAFGIFTSFFLTLDSIGLMIAIVVWGLAGYFAAQMLLDKSFRVFHKWKGAAAVTGVFVLLFLVVGFDLTGFETWVPNASDVSYAYASGSLVYCQDSGDYVEWDTDDPEKIALITTIHQEAVEQRDDEWTWVAANADDKKDTWRSTTVTLSYILKDGRTMSRRYYMHFDITQADQPGSAAWAVEQLYADREHYWRGYGFEALRERQADGGRLSVELRGYNSGNEELYFYSGDAAALLDAVEADFWAGRIGVRHVTDPEAPETELPVLYFSMEWRNERGDDVESVVRIRVQDTASETLAALARLEGEPERQVSTQEVVY